LPAYFAGDLNEADRERVETWKNESDENRAIFNDSCKIVEHIDLLRSMRKYNADEALQKFHSRIENNNRRKLFLTFQKVAAILLLPFIAATVYLSFQNSSGESVPETWYSFTTPAGVRSEFILPDSSKVYLNANSTLSYPAVFVGENREVKLEGEAYFMVSKNKNQPFIVNTGKIDIEVTGTEFKASNYSNEHLTEIVLVSGGIDLCSETISGSHQLLTKLVPGERALYNTTTNTMNIDRVDVDKYISWKDGILMFRDDPLIEVVRRMNRWFNVDIQLKGSNLSDYVYTATFEDESLMQILDLLKISAPIDYKIKKRERKKDHTFSKMEIEIIQK